VADQLHGRVLAADHHRYRRLRLRRRTCGTCGAVRNQWIRNARARAISNSR